MSCVMCDRAPSVSGHRLSSLQPTANCPQHVAFQAHLLPLSNCLLQRPIEAPPTAMPCLSKHPTILLFVKDNQQDQFSVLLSCSEYIQHVELTFPRNPIPELLYKSTSAPWFFPSANDSVPISRTCALYDTEMNRAQLLLQRFLSDEEDV